MTDKHIRIIQRMVKKIVRDILECEYIDDGSEPTIPVSVVDDIEEFIGEPIQFMGIS